MTQEAKTVTVHVKYGEIDKTFSGNVEDVWLLVSKFFNEFLPSFEVAKKLTLSVDLEKLTKDCDGLIAFSGEGANVLVSRNMLTDNDTLVLWLLAYYVGFRLGLLKTEELSKEELQVKLGKDAKITSTRLGELVKNQLAVRTADDKFKITTFGVNQVQKDVLPKIRTKL